MDLVRASTCRLQPPSSQPPSILLLPLLHFCHLPFSYLFLFGVKVVRLLVSLFPLQELSLPDTGKESETLSQNFP